MPYYYIDNDFSKAKGIDSDLDWFIINHLCELINDDEDWVIVVSFSVCWDWQTHDKIY